MVGGFTEGAAGVGSILVGAYQDNGLRYVGEVEFGFSPASRAALWRQFQAITMPRSPPTNLGPKRGAIWLAPRLLATITSQEWMDGFLGIRASPACETIPDRISAWTPPTPH